jgi:formylmethanofuran dehydrogenase subunit C
MRHRVPAVPAGSVVKRPYDNLYVNGDVGGVVEARTVIVEGDVLPGAGILARGGGAQIIIAGSASDRAVLFADGGGAEVIIMGNVR